jgi:outer membrane protein insertion porin family
MPSVGSTLGQPMQFQTPYADGPVSPTTGFRPRVRNAPIDVYVQEAQTGRMVFGGSVNTDLGVAGQVIIEERNFDLLRFPRSFQDLFNGAFRGNGENFRMELMPGNRVQRYSVNWTQPNLFGYSPWSLSVSGFLFDRIYQDWDEQRLGGRVMLGYQITPDLSFSTEVRGENVDISDPRITGVEALDSVVGDHELWTGRFRLAHNTRDSPFLPTEGHFLELIYDQVFGNFDFPRGQINYSKYFLIRERADGGGRHTLTSSWRFGFSGEETPIFENFFAGGFTTLRGFSFRGASPVESGVQVGGRFMFLGTLEYMFPITADDMLRMVTFVDYGTIERDIEVNSENFRVAPGLGFRIAVPALGPGPLAFDFAFPVSYSDTDDRQVFSFNVGVTR